MHRAKNRQWVALAHAPVISTSELAKGTSLALLSEACSTIARTARSRLPCKRRSPTEAHINVRTFANMESMKIVRRRDRRGWHNAWPHVSYFNRCHPTLVLQNPVHNQVGIVEHRYSQAVENIGF